MLKNSLADNQRMIEDINYRKLEPQESTNYRKIRLESLQKYPNSFGANYEEQRKKPKLFFENLIENKNPESFIIGAWHNDDLVGICGFYRNQDERSRHRGELIQMFVQPNYQEKQIGYNLLVKTVLEAFTIIELEQIELEVRADVLSANRIYAKLGFVEYDMQRKYCEKDKIYFDQRLMMLRRDKHIESN